MYRIRAKYYYSLGVSVVVDSVVVLSVVVVSVVVVSVVVVSVVVVSVVVVCVVVVAVVRVVAVVVVVLLDALAPTRIGAIIAAINIRVMSSPAKMRRTHQQLDDPAAADAGARLCMQITSNQCIAKMLNALPTEIIP